MLFPLNRLEHSPILLNDDDDAYRIVGWYVGCVPEIQRVEAYEYEYALEEI